MNIINSGQEWNRAISDGSNGGSGLTNKRRQGWYMLLLVTGSQRELEILALDHDEFDPDRTSKQIIKENILRMYQLLLKKGQALKLILIIFVLSK